MNVQKAMRLRTAPLQTPTDLKAEGVREISGALNVLLADVFALYLKTKNFHWHISGPHFRDYHLLLDEHGDQIFAMTDPIAERVRKIGGMTLRSIGEISRHQRIQDNDAEFVTPLDMLAELRDDNKELVAKMRETHGLCDEHNDVATASLLEVWIDGPSGGPGSCSRQPAPPSWVESILAIRSRTRRSWRRIRAASPSSAFLTTEARSAPSSKQPIGLSASLMRSAAARPESSDRPCDSAGEKPQGSIRG